MIQYLYYYNYYLSIYLSIYLFTVIPIVVSPAKSAGAVEYTECSSEDG